MMRLGFRNFLRGTAAASALVAFAHAVPAYAQTQTFAFDIPAQDLGSSLRAFARASHQQVTFDDRAVRGKMAQALKGAYTARSALDQLLDGSGLTVEMGRSGLFIVRAPASSATPPQAGEAEAGSAAAETESADIVVSGTRIRGVQNLAVPSMKITREDFAQTGHSSVQDVFENLPQNLGEINPDASFATGTSRVASSNTQNASGISLRGLGPGSTLTLLNGKRRAGNVDGRVVDISAIPLSVIERIDVVTGGNSSIYGSDAVAGVVNLVTRRDFDGAETQAYYGAGEHGGDRLQLSQIVGKDFGGGGIVASIDYGHDGLLDAVDAGAIIAPSASGLTTLALPMQPKRDRISVFVAGHADLNDDIELYGDVLFTNTKTNSLNDQLLPPFPPFTPFPTRQIQARRQNSNQYSVSLGAKIDLGSSWQLDVSGLHSVSRNTSFGDSTSTTVTPLPVVTRSESKNTTEATLSSFSAVADGRLFEIGGRAVKAAFGVEIRGERLSDKGVFNGTPSPEDSIDRTVKSVFGELFVPVFGGGDGAFPGSLDVTISGRYDHYSDFGGTFNPQFGAVWEPLDGLKLRGAYSTAYRAPDLFNLKFGSAQFTFAVPDPQAPAGPPFFGQSLLLINTGGNPDLQPETAKTWSAGFDYAPPAAPWLQFGASYFNISYKDRIEQPADDAIIFAILQPQNESNFGLLIDRNVTVADFDAFIGDGSRYFGIPAAIMRAFLLPFTVSFDNRFQNVAVDKVRGVDANLATKFAVGDGQLTFGLNGTYYLDSTRRLVVGGPTVSQLNRPGKPADFRFRANAGITQGPFGAFLQVNYVDGYPDTFHIPTPANPGPVKIGSWTTADLTVRLDTASLVEGGPFDDLTMTLSATNLLNERPPFFGSNISGVNFDAANTNAMGRFVSFRVVKKW